MRCIFAIILFIIPLYSFANTIQFPHACIAGDKITIAAVGDVLLHQPLQKKAAVDGFQSLWKEALPYIQSATIAYANLEGPMADGVTRNGRVLNQGSRWNDEIYTSYPMFNYHPSLAAALRKSGFNIVSTANNHALDRYALGIDKTIDHLKEVGLQYCGTRLRNSQQERVAIIQKNNWKVAWIACTEMTNGMTDKFKQVLHCYNNEDRQWILQTIHTLRNQVDAIIVSPHWGDEYQNYPNVRQKLFAHLVLDAGATAVIGSHPHVLQPMEKYITKDGRATFIVYSMGNFVSYQGAQQTRSTIILLLGLTKTKQGVVINGVKYVPMYMQNRGNKLYLSCLTKEKDNNAMQLITKILPVGNILSQGEISTNPECQ